MKRKFIIFMERIVLNGNAFFSVINPDDLEIIEKTFCLCKSC